MNPSQTKPSFTTCPILYQDPYLVIVDKPQGVLSHPNPAGDRKYAGTRTQKFGSQKAAFEGDYNLETRTFKTPQGPLWLIHRLDQDTSGALLAAFDQATAEKCRQIFEHGQIEKSYLALVSGLPQPMAGKWADHLSVKREKGKKRTTTERGATPNAKLAYVVKKNFNRRKLCLLEIDLHTGKTHQIRVQAASRKFPVAGDTIYGDFQLNRKLKQEIGLRRLFLHAASLRFRHPHTGENLTVQAPLPKELEAVLAQL